MRLKSYVWMGIVLISAILVSVCFTLKGGSPLIEANTNSFLIDGKAAESGQMLEGFGEINDSRKIIVSNARELDLSEINNAEPDGYFQELLNECEALRSELMRIGEAASTDKWESEFQKLTEIVRLVKLKQQVRYTLWAERVFRQVSEADTTDGKSKINHYLLLSKIDGALVAEPSLARAIVKELYKLYDGLPVDDCTEVRYRAIRGLEGRKRLEDF